MCPLEMITRAIEGAQAYSLGGLEEVLQDIEILSPSLRYCWGPTGVGDVVGPVGEVADAPLAVDCGPSWGWGPSLPEKKCIRKCVWLPLRRTGLLNRSLGRCLGKFGKLFSGAPHR